MQTCEWVELGTTDTCPSSMLETFTWRSDAADGEQIDARGSLVVERADTGQREVYDGIERWVYDALAHRAFEDEEDGASVDAFFERHVLDRGEPTATR